MSIEKVEQAIDTPELMTVKLPDGFTETYMKLSDYKALESAAVQHGAELEAARAERDAARADSERYLETNNIRQSALFKCHSEIDALTVQLAEARAEVERWWDAVMPSTVEALPSVAGMISQLNNYYAGEAIRCATLRTRLERVTALVEAVAKVDWTPFHAAFLHMRDEYGNTPVQDRLDKAFDDLEKIKPLAAAALAEPVDAGERESVE